jgi:hypothetical protein
VQTLARGLTKAQLVDAHEVLNMINADGPNDTCSIVSIALNGKVSQRHPADKGTLKPLRLEAAPHARGARTRAAVLRGDLLSFGELNATWRLARKIGRGETMFCHQGTDGLAPLQQSRRSHRWRRH